MTADCLFRNCGGGEPSKPGLRFQARKEMHGGESHCGDEGSKGEQGSTAVRPMDPGSSRIQAATSLAGAAASGYTAVTWWLHSGYTAVTQRLRRCDLTCCRGGGRLHSGYTAVTQRLHRHHLRARRVDWRVAGVLVMSRLHHVAQRCDAAKPVELRRGGSISSGEPGPGEGGDRGTWCCEKRRQWRHW